MTGSYNRRKGHNYERSIARELRKYFPDAVTSRSGSRGEDPRGIDIIRTGMFNIQVKARQNLNPFDVLFREMPDNQNINIVFWKRNRQKEIVIIDKEGFYELLQILKQERIL
jgi:hypothetical protein